MSAALSELAGTPQDPLLGQIVSTRYQIDSFISAGGMGLVYKARHIVLDKPIALKVLREVQDYDAQQRFLLEAKSACHIGHEHIVDITDFGVLEDNRPYLVMEFLQGQTLEAVIAKGPMKPARVCRIGEQVARGLQAVHDKGILHRDLKPGNIFLLDRQKRDFVKILDFGIAKVMAGERDSLTEQPKPLVNMRATTQGTVLGTPEYLSPEQASGEPIDVRCDQYALGCILYEMLTGTVPFKGNGPMGTLMKHLTEKPVPPRQRRPELNLTESLERIVLRAMAQQKEARFASMEELAQALQDELEGSGHSYLGDSAVSLSGMSSPSTASGSGTTNPAFAPTQAMHTTGSRSSPLAGASTASGSDKGRAAAILTQPPGKTLGRVLGLVAALLVLLIAAVGVLIWQNRTQAKQLRNLTPQETPDKTPKVGDKVDPIPTKPTVAEDPKPTEVTPDKPNPLTATPPLAVLQNATHATLTARCDGQSAQSIAPKKTATVLAGGGGSCLISAPGFRPKLLFFVQLRTDVLKHKPTKVALDPESKKPVKAGKTKTHKTF